MSSCVPDRQTVAEVVEGTDKEVPHGVSLVLAGVVPVGEVFDRCNQLSRLGVPCPA